jgi:hypothetical protein
LQSIYAPIAEGLHSDCIAFVRRLQGDWEAAQRLDSDREVLLVDCIAIAKQLQSNCTAIAQQLHSKCKAFVRRLQSDWEAIA